MPSARIREIIRHFPENSMKLMLENPRNARDLLLLSGAKVVELIDCDHLTWVKTTFVKRDYRHIESDVVLLAPVQHRKEERLRRAIVIYILIEHQSEPDRLMPLRLLEYVVQIFASQTREWSRRHRSTGAPGRLLHRHAPLGQDRSPDGSSRNGRRIRAGDANP